MKRINKIIKEQARRNEQIENLEELTEILNYWSKKSINEYEKKYIKQIIGQVKYYNKWLEDELNYLDEDFLEEL